MTQNPYAAPEYNDNLSQGDEVTRNAKRLDTLSRISVISCSLWLLMIIAARFFDKNAPPLVDMLGLYGVVGFAPALGLWGALSALKRQRYAIAVVGAVCLAIPILGPWFGLTLPLGVWSLVLLRRPDVRESFASAAPTGSSNSDDADDAMAHAAHLDTMGDWDAAISAYREAANRWPEHSTYIGNCIAEITRKQSAAK